MSKNILLGVIVSTLLFAAGCKKCFTCNNECVQCSIVVNSHTFSHTLCKDSFDNAAAYNAAIASDTSIGYTCAATASTYKYDFCVNGPGEEGYPDYFNKGKRVTCTEK